MSYDWRPYVPVAKRRAQASRELARRAKSGQPASPVIIEGRTIARTFWGRAWCENLERYSDYANRLPRGRTYARNGSIVDLRVGPGRVDASVMGSELYSVRVEVSAVPAPRWASIREDCAGAIDSLVELLQGRLSKGVMERICRQGTGLFPSPREITLRCSCPDYASMCKHVAAVLYGVGARLDTQPELLFRLRGVDERELIVHAGRDLPLGGPGPEAGRVLDDGDLSSLFGLELDDADPVPPPPAPPPAPPKPAPPPEPEETRALRTAVASAETRLAFLRAHPDEPDAANTITVLEGWIARKRVALS